MPPLRFLMLEERPHEGETQRPPRQQQNQDDGERDWYDPLGELYPRMAIRERTDAAEDRRLGLEPAPAATTTTT